MYFYLYEGECTEVCKCRRCQFAICGSLKFNHQETVVYMFTQLWKRRGVSAVQKAVINMYFNSDSRRTQEVGTVVPIN